MRTKSMTPASRATVFAQAMNFGRSASGRPSKLADDRERQHSRVALDEIGRASVREQLAGEIVGDGANARLHVENRAAAERLVDDLAQARVIRLVHGQHVVGERADEGRHPPAQAGDAHRPPCAA